MKKIFIIPLLQILVSCSQKAEPELYLIPSGYLGRVEILFNQNGAPIKYTNDHGNDTVYVPKIGRPTKYEGERRVYEIPSDGLLLSQFGSNDGFIDRKYFSVDSVGRRTPLKTIDLQGKKSDSAQFSFKKSSENLIFGDGTSGSYGNMKIPYQYFIVSTYNLLDSFNTKEYSRNFDKKVENVTGLVLHLD